MPDQPAAAPDSTAVRTALWRAMHVEVDPPPHVLEDEIGLKLAAPDEGWRNRQDMHPQWTRGSVQPSSCVPDTSKIDDLAATPVVQELQESGLERSSSGLAKYPWLILVDKDGIECVACARPTLLRQRRGGGNPKPPVVWQDHQPVVRLCVTPRPNRSRTIPSLLD